MNAFEQRYSSLLDHCSIDGWDGHYAKAITQEVRDKAYLVWLDYKLYQKPHDLVPSTTGAISFEVESIHGWLDIYVTADHYIAGICDNSDRTVMPDITRKF